MRRNLAVAVTLLMFLAVAVPALAQAPAAPAPSPRVTIVGLVDNVSSYSRNMSILDTNPARAGDKEWYARTRIRPDIIAELGTTKFVLGLEIDSTWGQTANADTNVCTGAACAGGGQRFGTTSGWDLNTDTQGIIEIKWAYTEFRMPLIPWQTLVRVGAQPWQAMYKPGVYATGDFPGLHITSTINPNLKLHMTYAAVEEELTGPRDGFLRGEDWAFVGSVEWTPVKGVDLRPIYSYFSADSITNGGSRTNTGGVPNALSAFPAAGTIAGKPNFHEGRHTLGLDARMTFGAFFVDPTLMYQWGQRELIMPSNPAAAQTVQEQGISAWFFDVRAGWRLGPLLLEAAAAYTTGNSADENLRHGRRTVNYFQPLSTDSGYFGTWCQIWCLDIDYFNAVNNGVSGLNPVSHIGYDKYGLIRLATKATYAITPAFSLRGSVVANWTAETVDTSEVISPGLGRVTCAAPAQDATVGAVCANGGIVSDGRGDARYLGTEVDFGFTWRFAPGITFDLVGGYNFSGPALSAAYAQNAAGQLRSARGVKDIQTIATRLRFNF
jgi:hypothetical protein